MSKHNYSQYSNKNNQNTQVEETTVVDTEVVNDTVVIENVEPEIKVVEETVETVTLPETVTGVVANCGKLNVRANPEATAAVVCVLDVNSNVEINLEKSTDEWFSVHTAAGVEGYCMRKFVNASL